MQSIEKSNIYKLEILKHVEETPMLTNRIIAAKLGCSIKLAHSILTAMVTRGFLHVKKLHSRRWDYFLTPKGIAEKAKLTYEYLDFSMQFFHEARKRSSQVCREIAEAGRKKVAFLGTGELAEIAYLGVKEWDLKLIEIFGENENTAFLGLKTSPLEDITSSKADIVIVCIFNSSMPMSENYLPGSIKRTKNMRWIF